MSFCPFRNPNRSFRDDSNTGEVVLHKSGILHNVNEKESYRKPIVSLPEQAVDTLLLLDS